jgi:hypothetical protein
MSKKSRYLLLAVGFVLFLILAPLLVMYAGGIVYNPSEHAFVKTGLLSIRSDPKSAQVFLDGKLKRNSAGDLKFLLPKEYEITLKKTGYYDWDKRLSVDAGQVTWASPSFGKVYLFKNNLRPENVGSNVMDFDIQNNRLAYITSAGLTFSSLDKGSQNQNYSLPKPVNSLKLAPSGRYAVLADEKNTLLLFDSETGKFTDLTGVFDSGSQLKFSPQNELFILDKDSLYRFSLGQKQLVLKNVLAFGFEADNLYYVKKTENGNELLLATTASAEGQLLKSSLPDFESGDLFVTFDKQIILLADQTLYSVNSGMLQLASGVSVLNFNPDHATLVFVHGSELDDYNFLSHQLEFITRSEKIITQPNLPPQLGNAFYVSDNTFSGIELDTRDRQNRYQFYQGSDLTKLWINNDGSEAWFLDSGNLKNLQLR